MRQYKYINISSPRTYPLYVVSTFETPYKVRELKLRFPLPLSFNNNLIKAIPLHSNVVVVGIILLQLIQDNMEAPSI